MIVKDKAARPTQDRMRQAGDEAEAQMAFYLRRAFGTDPDIHVFHDLRIEEDGDAAQIDHLVLHRHGAIVVESKSVTSAVRINDREEWARQWNGHWTGMPSPVLQARRQADFLRAYRTCGRGVNRCSTGPCLDSCSAGSACSRSGWSWRSATGG